MEFMMLTIRPAPFLRQALLSDAVTSAACALFMLVGSGLLEGMLGLPAVLLRAAGLVLIPYALLCGCLGLRETLHRRVVLAVVAGNVLWAAGSLLLLAGGWVSPTAAGYAFVIAQAVVVAMYAELQWIGLRRSLDALA
jgi:hypothetical protein